MYASVFSLHWKGIQDTAEVGKVVDRLHNDHCFRGDGIPHASKLKNTSKVGQPIELQWRRVKIKYDLCEVI